MDQPAPSGYARALPRRGASLAGVHPCPSMRTLLVLSFVALTGCSLSRSAAVDPLTDSARLNRDVAGRTVTVVVEGRGPLRVRSLHVAPDTTTWIDPATGTLGRAATAAVLAVERRSRLRGVVRGAATMAAVGAVGGVVGALVADLGACGQILWDNCERGPAMVFFGVAGATMLAPSGALVGGVVGDREQWELAHPVPPTAALPARNAGRADSHRVPPLLAPASDVGVPVPLRALAGRRGAGRRSP